MSNSINIKDPNININWLIQSAKNGDDDEQHNLGLLLYDYNDDEGTEKNLEKAFHWFQKAAEKDHIKAQYKLALLYYNGEGTENNLEKAFYWFQKAAKKDHIKAQYNLALLYYNGEGTEKNLEKAFYWYQKAAEK